MTIYSITPVPAPRMTQSDKYRKGNTGKWKVRDCVQRYWDFRKEVKERGVTLLPDDHVIFYLPIPKSWSKKKKAAHIGQPHTQKPDTDNLYKALSDSIYGDDSHIWKISAEKRWANGGAIEIVRAGEVLC